jgi:hypothetical protein
MVSISHRFPLGLFQKLSTLQILLINLFCEFRAKIFKLYHKLKNKKVKINICTQRLHRNN